MRNKPNFTAMYLFAYVNNRINSNSHTVNKIILLNLKVLLNGQCELPVKTGVCFDRCHFYDVYEGMNRNGFSPELCAHMDNVLDNNLDGMIIDPFTMLEC